MVLWKDIYHDINDWIMCLLLLVLKHGFKQFIIPQGHHVFRIDVDTLRLLDYYQLVGFLSIIELFILGDVSSRRVFIPVIMSDKDSMNASASIPLLNLQGAANRTHPYIRVKETI